MSVHFCALMLLARLTSARVVWTPEDFSPLIQRASTCGEDASLAPCGSQFPSNFCCGADTQCLMLNTTASTTAALCCPAGQDCQNIATITCDESLQNATSNPASPLHADPPVPLTTCGNACCPMGYSCESGACKMQALPSSAATASTIIALTSAALSTAATGTAITSSSGVTTITATADPVDGTSTTSISGPQTFSGSSFAAGFVPGILLGALVVAGLFLCMLRRQKRKRGAYTGEKHYSSGRDTLTDLGPETRPRLHGRSISEPRADASLGHRTEFLNSSSPSNSRDPAHLHGSSPQMQTDEAIVRKAKEGEEPRAKGWVSRSPFLNSGNSPIPAFLPFPTHLKRGTLSFSISPVRALRKQRSMHSLRRHMENSKRPARSRTGSTETIKVLMDTPDTRPKLSNTSLPSTTHASHAHYQASSASAAQPHAQQPWSAKTWTSTSSGCSEEDGTPIEAEPNTYTPTRPGRNSDTNDVGASLQSPYTPSNYANHARNNTNNNARTPQPDMLQIPGNQRNSVWRQTAATTFSGMMEKAGLRKSMLLLGPDPRSWNR